MGSGCGGGAGACRARRLGGLGPLPGGLFFWVEGLGVGASSSRDTLGTGGTTYARREGGFLTLELWLGIPEGVIDWGSLWNQLRGRNLEGS